MSTELERDIRIQQAILAYEKSSTLFEPLGVKFSADAKQGKISQYWNTMMRMLEWRGLPLPDISTLSFLDLGGGSDQPSVLDVRNGDARWQPWLCRYLAAMGAPNVVNVDIGPQNPDYHDVYTHIQLELTDKEDFSLPTELEKQGQLRKYDMIFSSMLAHKATDTVYIASPSLSDSIDRRKLRDNKMMLWATQLLKEGGYLFLDHGFNGFILLDGKLIDISEVKK